MENEQPTILKYRIVLVTRPYRGSRKITIKGRADTKEAAIELRDQLYARCPKHVYVVYEILGPVQYKNLLAKVNEEKIAIRKQAAKKASDTRKKNGTTPNFICCPTCGAKSKKLYSEMGGLQTRKCQNGHLFEKDTWGGNIIPARRIESAEQGFFVGPRVRYGRFDTDR
jgi:hypothetical protein